MRIDTDEIAQLSIEERLKLIEFIWDSLDKEPDDRPLTEEERKEMDRRWEAYQANPDRAAPWPEAKESIRNYRCSDK